MTKVATSERQRAARARRWCSRVLLGLAGAVAGTAAAWAVATSAAAADTQETPAPGAEATQADLNPVTNAAVDGLRDVTSGAARLAGDASGAVAHSARQADGPAEDCARPDRPGHTGGPATDDQREARPREARHLDSELATEVSGAVTDFTERAVVKPVQRTLGSLEHVVRQPQDTPQVIERALTPERGAPNVGTALWGLLHPGGKDLVEQLPGLPRLPELPGTGAGDSLAPAPGAEAPVPAGPGSVTVELPESAKQLLRAAADARHTAGDADRRHAGSEPVHRDGSAPAQPVRLPLAPVTAPAAPGGALGGGHLDGQLLGLPMGQPIVSGAAPIGDVRCGVQSGPFEPGTQPGVTPD